MDDAPERCPCALLLIDVINDLAFDGGARLLKYARPAAKRIAALAARCREAGIPVIYVNDNFGRWRSDFRAQVRHCSEEGVRGAPLARLLSPANDDYFVLKPMNSGFYSTVLDPLLRELGVETLILCGFAGDNCVLFTAVDAHMRGFRLVVPRDGVASETAASNRWAVDHMKRTLDADPTPSADIDLARLRRPRR